MHSLWDIFLVLRLKAIPNVHSETSSRSQDILANLEEDACNFVCLLASLIFIGLTFYLVQIGGSNEDYLSGGISSFIQLALQDLPNRFSSHSKESALANPSGREGLVYSLRFCQGTSDRA